MTREECQAALASAPRVLPSDDVQAAILATLLRIEGQETAKVPPPAEPAAEPPKTPRRRSKKRG